MGYLPETTAQAMADEIHRLHELAELAQCSAVHGLSSLVSFRRQCASIVEAAHASMGGARFMAWWNDQGLPIGWGGRYLTIARTNERNAIGDKNQLKLMGFMPSVEIGDHEDDYRQSSRCPTNPLSWMSPFVKFKARFTDELISGFDEVQREIARREIKPLVELYNKLEGGA